MRRIKAILACVLLLPTFLLAAEETFFPPAPVRELRGAWIATVANIDWPSKPGLPVAQQKAELIALLDRAAALHLNAIFFQVRPVADAFYASPHEPWSEYLTGVQGKMPSPFYDPLTLAVTAAHQRGLQLHAWFNPFRAGHPEAKSPPAANHAVRTHPELIRHYGSETWFDPGEPEAQARALNAVLDVLKRYDVDGIVFDDYFYPYPQKDSQKRELPFPDDASWKKYGGASGLSRNDWRRDNVNRFVQKISQSVHAAKPGVLFGISPFGIWRPGTPAGISPKALDAYDKLYADGRRWLTNGWVDYLAPQLYWPIAQQELSFTTLLQWWRQQNPKGRHVWAGLYDAMLPAEEIGRQIPALRSQSVDRGAIHYHLRSILDNPALNAIIRTQYSQPALVPATPWLDATPPDQPKLAVTAGKSSTTVRWGNGGAEPAQWWLLQVCHRHIWTTEILPAGQMNRVFENLKFDTLALRAVDRLGNLSAPTTWPGPKPTQP